MKTNRREFIKAISRNLLLAGLAGMSGYLVFKNENSENDTCNLDFACKHCKRIKNCNLPQATDFKRNNYSNQTHQP